MTAQLELMAKACDRIHGKRDQAMSQQSMRQAAWRPALDAKQRGQRTCRTGTPTRTFAVAVLTALGDRGRAVRDAKRRAGEALRVMTDDEGLSFPGSAWGSPGSLPAF